MLRHHFSPNGRISCSNTQALRGCARERGETVATIFGHPAKEPNLESATKTAVERINKDAASMKPR